MSPSGLPSGLVAAVGCRLRSPIGGLRERHRESVHFEQSGAGAVAVVHQKALDGRRRNLPVGHLGRELVGERLEHLLAALSVFASQVCVLVKSKEEAARRLLCRQAKVDAHVHSPWSYESLVQAIRMVGGEEENLALLGGNPINGIQHPAEGNAGSLIHAPIVNATAPSGIRCWCRWLGRRLEGCIHILQEQNRVPWRLREQLQQRVVGELPRG
mmetsp:Transcript_81177/g.146518  ORF Transcript_81177/g.146518 Transcript_81177/m.146518 type:complete len:214 (-) Transcript_81177:1389-2030(-)